MSSTETRELGRESLERVDPKSGRKKNPMVVPGITILALLTIVFGIRYWVYASAHVSTDDAYLTSDIVTIAPQVSGTVIHVYVKDNQHVEAGQLLAVLDDSTYRAAVQQAGANLEAAVAAAEASGVNIGLTGDTGNAQIQQAQAGVDQAESATGTSQADVERVKAAVIQASANARGVKASIATAKAAIISAKAQKTRAQAGVEAMSALVETSVADIRAAQAAVDAAQAVYEKAVKDNQRYQRLLHQSVIGEQAAEQAAVGEQIAKSELQTARERLAAGKSALSARRSDLRAAEEQVNAADAGVEQAQSQYSAANEQYVATDAGVFQARAQLVASERVVNQAQAKHEQATAQLAQARTTPKQVRMSEAEAHQAQARVSQARAALVDAKLRLSYTRITAPVSGIVSKKSVNEGILVQPGMPLMAIVPPPPANIWVVANFKETQLANVKSGQSAAVTIDAVPGRSFTAKVDSLSAGTGATFALLPPDNATGNFTKVVQRIPVKLTIDPNQADIDLLRSGMSVTAVIDTK